MWSETFQILLIKHSYSLIHFEDYRRTDIEEIVVGLLLYPTPSNTIEWRFFFEDLEIANGGLSSKLTVARVPFIECDHNDCCCHLYTELEQPVKASQPVKLRSILLLPAIFTQPDCLVCILGSGLPCPFTSSTHRMMPVNVVCSVATNFLIC